MRKPSKSPTVLLKEKVKHRILTKKTGEVGKSEGPATSSGEKPPADSDVPPTTLVIHPVIGGDGSFLGHADASGQFYPKTKFSGWKPYVTPSQPVKGEMLPTKVTFLPTTDSTSINQQARQVITKLKPSKLDPNSAEAELARLENSQLRTGKKPAASKGKEES